MANAPDRQLELLISFARTWLPVAGPATATRAAQSGSSPVKISLRNHV
jgi:hypothetical protein